MSDIVAAYNYTPGSYPPNRCSVVSTRLDDGSIRMYYTGQGTDGSTAIGVAKFDTSTNEWVREQAEFSFA